MSDVEPCKTCDAPVRVIRRRGDGAASGHADLVDVRICTSNTCPTNSREKSLGDVV